MDGRTDIILLCIIDKPNFIHLVSFFLPIIGYFVASHSWGTAEYIGKFFVLDK